MTSTLPAAVLWDMDGTIVDTEPYWIRAEGELVREWGGTWSAEEGLQLVGSGLRDAAAVFQSRGVGLSIDEIVDTLTDRVHAQVVEVVPWRPGARELLASVRAVGIPTALVTMSLRRMALEVAEAVGPDAQGDPSFDLVVAGDDVERPKPDPAPYLLAAERLGIDPRDAVAIEDSKPGIASAVASGAVALAVPLHVALPESPAYTRWDGLEGRTVEDLAEIFAASRVAR
ncbi:HAD family hydrolase [Homoserinibacter sp. YIM 151385]|uniref:HAD family hydrolase n=1 Tax=Homoserinibacter sp. YIM 151385 TaxID=2985506 RepID=UPI0022F08F22|nr:HAD family phosphatase [Homoserinibacter sp. YIM 151385]WBU38554.1 HAD family phosphatase [Homoserinibacter sp. YIM 151385]